MINIKFKKLNKNKSNGTFLIGYIDLPYSEIVSLFGEPYLQHGKGEKIDWEWVFQLDGTILTIYNYKTGPSYSEGNKYITPQEIDDWHVGGNYSSNLKILRDYIEQESNIKRNSKFLVREA